MTTLTLVKSCTMPPPVEESPLEQKLNGVRGLVRLISQKYDPEENTKPWAKMCWAVAAGPKGGGFKEYGIVTYDTGEEKQAGIAQLVRMLPNHTGILVEVRPNGKNNGYNVTNFSPRCFLLQDSAGRGITRQEVAPRVSAAEVREAVTIVYGSKDYAEYHVSIYPEHPVIKPLLGLKNDPAVQRRLQQGKFPYLLVDSNPDDVTFDEAKCRALFEKGKGDVEKYNAYFHLANGVYATDIDRLIRAYAVPVIFLVTWKEKENTLGPQFYDDAACRRHLWKTPETGK